MIIDFGALRGRIEHILSVVDLTGFTEQLLGECSGRYVVGMTDNHSWTVDLLVAQAVAGVVMHGECTIGGRTDGNSVVVDIGFTTDDRDEAMRLGRIYSQKAIRDTEGKIEIKL